MITIQNMKTPGKIFAIVFCALIALPAYSADVTYGDDTYTTGDPLTAADLNAKFNEIKAGVNSKANSADVTIEIDAAVSGLASTADVTAAIAADNTCPDDMVAVGSFCIDKFEASIWDGPDESTATAFGQSSPFTAGTMNEPCLDNGSDCAVGDNPIYALSVPNVYPAYELTYNQAVVACANVGKRLPTAAEWQAAAAGTTEGFGIKGDTDTCNNPDDNLPAGIGTLRLTGMPANCISNAGAYDMVGNLYELTADLVFDSPISLQNLDDAYFIAFGDNYEVDGVSPTHSPRDAFMMLTSSTGNYTTGFRCAK